MRVAPQCCFCIHFDASIDLNGKKRKCRAFKQIPKQIWDNKRDHNKIEEGQIADVIFEERKL